MRSNTTLSIRCILSTLSVCIASISMVDVALAEFWYEDFADGTMNDAGIDWFFERDHSISPDGLQLSSPERRI